MSYEEKRAWIMAVGSTAMYGAYVAIILNRAREIPLPETPYVSTLLWTVGISIVATIVLTIIAGMTSPKGEVGKKDQRDREIHRFGEYVGQAFLVMGGVAGLLMAMAQWPYFWIANAIYLGFTLSAILAAIAKIIAYRRGFQTW
jgi:cell division protein FtsW (lipid II flippase)